MATPYGYKRRDDDDLLENVGDRLAQRQAYPQQRIEPVDDYEKLEMYKAKRYPRYREYQEKKPMLDVRKMPFDFS